MIYTGDSQQEKFVLDVLDYKKNGYYVELGAHHSSRGSNTFVLEKEYDWKGVSFEIDEDFKKEFTLNRSNPCEGDALKFDYLKYFTENSYPKNIDYLQIDIDAGYSEDGRPYGNPYTTLHGLISLPLTQYRFNVITFEHDSNMYYKNTAMRDAQREILDSLGYALVIREMHEDFWVDPNVVPLSKYREYFKWATL